MRKIRIFNTPEAKQQGKPYEEYRILDENSEGVLLDMGYKHWGFMPWQYLANFVRHTKKHPENRGGKANMIQIKVDGGNGSIKMTGDKGKAEAIMDITLAAKCVGDAIRGITEDEELRNHLLGVAEIMLKHESEDLDEDLFHKLFPMEESEEPS